MLMLRLNLQQPLEAARRLGKTPEFLQGQPLIEQRRGVPMVDLQDAPIAQECLFATPEPTESEATIVERVEVVRLHRQHAIEAGYSLAVAPELNQGDALPHERGQLPWS